MQRVIYEVYAKVVDSNGSYNTLSSEVFDSKSFGGDVDKTLLRAKGKFHEVVGAMCKAETRQLQSVILMSADCQTVEVWHNGTLADLPDSTEATEAGV